MMQLRNFSAGIKTVLRSFMLTTAAFLSFASNADVCTPTNIVVAPLTDAHWTQGAPYNDYSPKGTTAFTSGWQDVEFDAPGDSNRFFRVKVTY